MEQSSVEKLLNALINGEAVDIIPQTNIEHFLKECADRVVCEDCPKPVSRIDNLLILLRDSLISSGSGSAAKPEQEKTINISENGQTIVTPNSGYALSKVTVNVNVSLQNKLAGLIGDTLETITAADLDGLTSIRVHAFYDCDSLKSVEIPVGVTSIGEYAFAYCSNLESVILPTGLNTIGAYVFSYCSNLTSLTIPASVTVIGQNALRIGESDNKSIITMLPTTPPSIDTSTFSTARLNQIIVPAGSGAAYKSAANWIALADYIIEATA